ncbi:MAG: DUF6288 domain-containing protein [Verrucomicrobiales bacterium]
MPLPRRIHLAALIAVFVGWLIVDCPAAPRGQMPNPDFTKGEPIPEGASHDWTLGATGARGWMYSNRLETSEARQIAITKVAKGSPADGVLQVGDVILGINRQKFSSDPRSAFGKALTLAEAGDGNLTLIRWRDNSVSDVSVKLPVLGRYSATAPYDCPKSKRIFEDGCRSLAKRMEESDYARRQNPITRSLNALALLASGNEAYLPLLRNEVKWASEYSADSMQTWYYAYVIMLLAEYQMATGDNGFEAGLRRLALEAAKGQSNVGSWGHKFALPDGRLAGYGMMNAPGVPLTISLIMARQAGIKDPAIDLAISRSSKFQRFYIGKGAVPYGDHHPWTQNHDDNGKCGMAGVMFNLLGEKDGAEFFSRMCVASHGPERDTGHTGNFTNMSWSMPGVALAGPQATGAWMHEFGAWYFDLARGWDGSFRHQGPPEKAGDKYFGWDATGAFLLAYAMPLKKIMLTGKQPNTATQIDAATAESLIRDGRGWSNNNRNSAYDSLSQEQLLERLGSWSPTVRERSAEALQRRKGEKPIAALVEMLRSPNLNARYGACEALKQMRGDAAPAVAELTALLDHNDLWLRVVAADALANIGKPAMVSLPLLLKRLAEPPAKEDPRGMEQRYLCFAIFGQMLKDSPAGADPEMLRQAIVAGLQNEDGRARGTVSGIYGKLPYDQLKPLLPAIHRAVVEPAPSGEMFADGVRIRGLELLAEHHIQEGMKASVDYIRSQNKWASEKRTPELLKILQSYGAHAKAFIPQLLEIADTFDKGEEGFPGQFSKDKARIVREAVKAIEAAEALPELSKLP